MLSRCKRGVDNRRPDGGDAGEAAINGRCRRGDGSYRSALPERSSEQEKLLARWLGRIRSWQRIAFCIGAPGGARGGLSMVTGSRVASRASRFTGPRQQDAAAQRRAVGLADRSPQCRVRETLSHLRGQRIEVRQQPVIV